MKNIHFAVNFNIFFFMIQKIPFLIHKVKAGENLKILSENFQIPATKILLDNNLSPKQIKEGTLLLLKK